MAVGRVGNTSFTVKDPDGHIVEFLSYGADGLMGKARGTAVPANRVSTTMSHFRVLVGSLKVLDGLLPGRSRVSRDVAGQPRREVARLGEPPNYPDGSDYVEFMLYGELPAQDQRGSQHHVCLVVPDIEAAAALVKGRAAEAGYTRPIETRTGINRGRELNLFDPDGTKERVDGAGDG